MTRIKIKSRAPGKDKKLKLIEILSGRDIEVSRIFTTHDGFAVVTITEQHADSIFNKETKDELAGNDFNPVMPHELKAKKSVIIPRVDDLIYEWSSVDIGEEIVRQNTWIGGELEGVFKFPNSPTLKLTFSQTTLAKKCTEIGIKAFNISIPNHEIKLETYIPIKCCMKCYALEDHFTTECTKSKDYRICSECSMEGHVWHQCKEQHKTCLNCGGNHSTTAMKCGKRKDIMKEKRTQEIKKQNNTYANIVQSLPFTSAQKLNIPVITKEEILKIHICVAHAQSKNQEKPGCYSYELNRILKANNLPNITIPDDEDEPIILDPTKPKDTTEPEETDILKRKATLKRQDSSGEATKLVDVKDVGLMIYTEVNKG